MSELQLEMSTSVLQGGKRGECPSPPRSFRRSVTFAATSNAAKDAPEQHYDEEMAAFDALHLKKSLGQGVTPNLKGRSNDDINLSTRSTRSFCLRDQYIRHLSSSLSVEDERDLDAQRLQRVVKEVGMDAFWVRAVEVWILDEDETGMLIRPEGGWWQDPSMSEDTLDQLNPTHEKYVPAEPVVPGVDIAGALWSESVRQPAVALPQSSLMKKSEFREGPNTKEEAESKSSTMKRTLTALTDISDSNQLQSVTELPPDIPERRVSFNGSLVHRFTRSFDSRMKLRIGGINSDSAKKALFREDDSVERNQIVWREIQALITDPDTPTSKRTLIMEQGGLTQAAGVPFEAGGRQGIAIFFSEQANGTSENIKALESEAYLARAASLIGTVIATCDARRACVAQRLRRSEILTPCKKSEAGRSEEENKSENIDNSLKRTDAKSMAKKRAKVWLRKCQGGNLQIPPPSSIGQALWTFVGCFCALLLIVSTNNIIKALSGGETSIMMGPIGALVALQYGITAAPAAQPRSIIFGQVLSGTIALCLKYIPDTWSAGLFHQVMAPSLAISVMVKLGITHPPAGAAALILATGNSGWKDFLCIVIASILSLIPAVVVNNMSLKRQYPTYWGLSHFPYLKELRFWREY